jgi:hypothetical protein
MPRRVALKACICCQHRLGRRAPAVPTSAIVDFFHSDVAQRETSLNGVNLVVPASRREAKPLTVQEGDHILPVHAVSGLPADVEGTAKLHVAK